MKYFIFITGLLILFSLPFIARSQDSYRAHKSILTLNSNDESNTNQPAKTRRLATEKHNVIGGQFGITDPWIGAYYERMIIPYWGIDVAVGLLGGSLGTKVYYPKLSDGKLSAYAGASRGFMLLIGTRNYYQLGLTYLAASGFRMSLDAGPQIFDDQGEENMIGFSLRIGKAF